MTATDQKGIVVYAGTNRVKRVVHPMPDDPEDILDDPHWVTFGLPEDQKFEMIKVDASDPRLLQRFSGAEFILDASNFTNQPNR